MDLIMGTSAHFLDPQQSQRFTAHSFTFLLSIASALAMVSNLCTGEVHVPSEHDPLLKWPSKEDGENHETERSVPEGIASKLYVSHSLSTWNSRVFEFGAVLYLATICPGTLLPMSAYAFTRGVSAIIFAPTVGHYIDTCDRLKVMRFSILVQRLVVAASCLVFYIITIQVPLGQGVKLGMLMLLALLACIEKLCSIASSVSVEKDWVVVVCEKDRKALRALNAKMRRIDLICKLIGPLFIALVDGVSTEYAIAVNFVMNIASVPIEYFAIARVYYGVPALQQAKKRSPPERLEANSLQSPKRRLTHSFSSIQQGIQKYRTDFGMYFRHRAFHVSMATSLLYLTVLNFDGRMVAYLLSTSYTSPQISIARALSVVFEMLATWMAPWLMSKNGPVPAGMWLSMWQTTMLATGATVFFVFYNDMPVVSASGLLGGVIFSRIGRIGFDLCAQLVVQEEVESDIRGAFYSVEAAWQSTFEIASYASTIIFFRPDQFKWPVLISVIAVATASFAFMRYVRLRRVHLVHLDMETKPLSREL